MWVYKYTHYSMLLRAPGELFHQRAIILASFLEITLIFLFFLCVFINSSMRFTGIAIHTQRNKAWLFEFFSVKTDRMVMSILDLEPLPDYDNLPYVVCDRGIKLKYGYINTKKKVAYVPETHPLFNISIIEEFAFGIDRQKPIKDMLKEYANKELLPKVPLER